MNRKNQYITTKSNFLYKKQKKKMYNIRALHTEKNEKAREKASFLKEKCTQGEGFRSPKARIITFYLSLIMILFGAAFGSMFEEKKEKKHEK
jgi:hypothetical protein